MILYLVCLSDSLFRTCVAGVGQIGCHSLRLSRGSSDITVAMHMVYKLDLVFFLYVLDSSVLNGDTVRKQKNNGLIE